MLKRKIKRLLSALRFRRRQDFGKGLSFGAAFHIEKRVQLKPTGKAKRFLHFLKNLMQ